MIKKIFIYCFLLPASVCTQAQPFINEINDFKKLDAASPPPKNSILFTGSSSFRLWKNLKEDFPGYTLLNRGFGGSSLTDVIRYAEEIIFPYQPKQVVIYCGENDIASSDTVSAEMVFERFEILFDMIRKKIPEVPIAFISIKPSPSRWVLKERMIRANELIKEFMKNKTHTAFINVWNNMLASDGKPMDDIFVSDKLHMNEKGYKIWQQLIEPHLLK